MPQPLAITFDVYGTLTRWTETLRDTLHTLLTGKGVPADDLSPAVHAFDAESRRLTTARSMSEKPFATLVQAAQKITEPDAEALPVYNIML